MTPEMKAKKEKNAAFEEAKKALQNKTQECLGSMENTSNAGLESAADELANELMKHVEHGKIDYAIQRGGFNRESGKLEGYVFEKLPESYGSFRHCKKPDEKDVRNDVIQTLYQVELEEKAIEEEQKQLGEVLAGLEKQAAGKMNELKNAAASIERSIGENDGKSGKLTEDYSKLKGELEKIQANINQNQVKLKQCEADLKALGNERKVQQKDQEKKKINTVNDEIKKMLAEKVETGKLTEEQADIFLKRFNLHFKSEGGENSVTSMIDAFHAKLKQENKGGKEVGQNRETATKKSEIEEQAILNDVEIEQVWHLRELKDGSFAYFNEGGRPLFEEKKDSKGKSVMEVVKVNKEDREFSAKFLQQKQNKAVNGNMQGMQGAIAKIAFIKKQLKSQEM
jgi:hypothetical protein